MPALACLHAPAEKKPAAPSDLNLMAAYHFGHARPRQADESGPAWLRSVASAHFFLAILFNQFVNPC
jgi:hypothetical protein